MSTTAPPAMSDVDYARFCEFFYQQTGIKFADTKRYFVDKRVAACMAEQGAEDFRGWFLSLRLGTSGNELQQLVNRLTVNETYFGREDHQFRSLVDHALPAVVAERRRRRDPSPIRILSLPCSTGEEPYSIAMTLLEQWRDLDTVDVTIVGADIDTSVIERARRGIYGARSLHLVPARHRVKYFEALGPDRWQICDDLRSAVAFTTVNLFDVASCRALRGFDVVFCRNLLIYFDQASSARAAAHLFDMLRPGGTLFLGHSESMSRISPIFDVVRFPEGLAYQRPKEADR